MTERFPCNDLSEGVRQKLSDAAERIRRSGGSTEPNRNPQTYPTKDPDVQSLLREADYVINFGVRADRLFNRRESETKPSDQKDRGKIIREIFTRKTEGIIRAFKSWRRFRFKR